ncbi:MAG TPA: hypothetical protein VNH64_11220, partial [Parvularculaceae bacterium]|nr:hypothetical protein [Parvularculaceae bacterium]
IATILLAPMYGSHQKVAGIEKSVSVTGYDYVKDTIGCWKSRNYSLKGDCKPKEGLKGQAILAALLMSAVAAAAGIFGFVPVIGRLASIVTTLAGIVTLAGMGYFAFSMMGGSKHDAALQWGAYLAGGGGLLTLISGLHGIRGGR